MADYRGLERACPEVSGWQKSPPPRKHTLQSPYIVFLSDDLASVKSIITAAITASSSLPRRRSRRQMAAALSLSPLSPRPSPPRAQSQRRRVSDVINRLGSKTQKRFMCALLPFLHRQMPGKDKRGACNLAAAQPEHRSSPRVNTVRLKALTHDFLSINGAGPSSLTRSTGCFLFSMRQS